MSIKPSTLNMSSSPSQIKNQSPKEKRTFSFFRSRTLSNSSSESTGGNANNPNALSNSGGSPGISPRALFERVRKRSQSDAKSQNSVDAVHGGSFKETHSNNASPNGATNMLYVTKKASSSSSSGVHGGSIIRKHLSHSISEEKDDETHSDSLNKINHLHPHYNNSNNNGNFVVVGPFYYDNNNLPFPLNNQRVNNLLNLFIFLGIGKVLVL